MTAGVRVLGLVEGVVDVALRFLEEILLADDGHVGVGSSILCHAIGKRITLTLATIQIAVSATTWPVS